MPRADDDDEVMREEMETCVEELMQDAAQHLTALFGTTVTPEEALDAIRAMARVRVEDGLALTTRLASEMTTLLRRSGNAALADRHAATQERLQAARRRLVEAITTDSTDSTDRAREELEKALEQCEEASELAARVMADVSAWLAENERRNG